MKTIYFATLEILNPTAIPNDPKELEVYQQLKRLGTIDLDIGQLEFYENRPAVSFPCALIQISIPRIVTLANNIQQCTAQIGIRVAFDLIGSTAKHTPSAIREKSLEYFDLIGAIYKAFQGKLGTGIGKFDRASVVEEKRPDGLKVVEIVFNTVFIDKSSA